MTKEQETGWNQIYQKPEAYQYYDLLKPHQDIPRLGEFFRSHNIESILDLGCGTGSNLLALAEFGFGLTGVDQSEEGVTIVGRRIKESRRGIKVSQARFQELPFENNQFDAVVSIQTLSHGYEADVRSGITEIERVLKPRGFIFITVPGRIANGQVRYCLVRTARKVDDRVYIPTKGQEIGVPHFIYNRKVLREHFSTFKQINMWQDDKDYYCFLGRKNV